MMTQELQDAQDDCLISIEDNHPLPARALGKLPPWRAVLIARVALAAGVPLEEGTLDQLIGEARRAGGDGQLGRWWERDPTLRKRPRMLIAVMNLSTLVSDSDVHGMTAAVSYQVTHHAAPAWGLIPPSVIYAKVAPTTPGAAVIGVFDDADQAGDLGWHTETAGGVIFGRVFAQPVLANGGNALTNSLSVASVLSHEVLETMLDPACDLWADAGNGTAYARELCDAVEGDSYPVSVSAGLGTAMIVAQVSDFLLPSWFDSQALPAGPFDWLHLLKSPFSVRPTGYVVSEAEGTVSQTFGEHYAGWRKATKGYPIARTARRMKQGSPRGAG